MRTIKFRGKRTKQEDPSERWIYGTLAAWRDIYDRERTCIVSKSGYHNEVDPATVGQFTGLLDKNGKEIYEGDILSTDLAIPRCEVVFRNGCFALRLNDGDEDFYDIISPIDESVDKTKYHNIIGSIHDNPELLNEK